LGKLAQLSIKVTKLAAILYPESQL